MIILFTFCMYGFMHKKHRCHRIDVDNLQRKVLFNLNAKFAVFFPVHQKIMKA